jgi:hypothetical protein
MTPSDKATYEKALQLIPPGGPRTRTQARPLWAQYRSGKKILDMCIEPMQIAGFSVLVRHGDEGASTQVTIHAIVKSYHNKVTNPFPKLTGNLSILGSELITLCGSIFTVSCAF